MKTILNKIKRTGLPVVKKGEAQNVKEFFEEVIEPQFKNKDAIKATHRALLKYIQSQDAVFVLRLYGSDAKKDYKNLRRGFLTVFPKGQRHVFCDNTFAMPFAAMKICGKAYTSKALATYMNDSTTRFGFGSTKEERELAFYNWMGNQLNINLNIQGWYLAHIVPVGKHYAHKSLKEHFNNPNRKEWSDHIDHIRRPSQDLTSQEEAVLKAHFLRMLHPLNSFLIPKRTLLAYDGKNIGEEPELLALVRDYIKKEFPQEYIEFCDFIMKPEEESSIASSIGKIIWNSNPTLIKKEKSIIKPERKMKSYNKLSSPKRGDTDSYEDNAGDRLENTLRSIGKETFIRLYPLVKKNISLDTDDVHKTFPEYARYSKTSQQTRLIRINVPYLT